MKFGDRWELLVGMFPRNEPVAEVGVQTGHFSASILQACSPSRLVLVDAWRHITGPYEADPANVSDEEHERRYRRCRERLGDDPRIQYCRMLSSEAASLFADESFGAVYLDADHTEAGVRADIQKWWPKVRSGGVLSGHDYTGPEEFLLGVRIAVDEFVRQVGLALIVTEEPKWASWAVVKP